MNHVSITVVIIRPYKILGKRHAHLPFSKNFPKTSINSRQHKNIVDLEVIWKTANIDKCLPNTKSSPGTWIRPFFFIPRKYLHIHRFRILSKCLRILVKAIVIYLRHPFKHKRCQDFVAIKNLCHFSSFIKNQHTLSYKLCRHFSVRFFFWRKTSHAYNNRRCGEKTGAVGLVIMRLIKCYQRCTQMYDVSRII